MNRSELLQHVSRVGEQLGQRLTEIHVSCREDHAALVPAVAQSMTGALAELSATGIWGRANLEPSSALWRVAGELLQRGRLQWQAHSKPRGYAGDFELLYRICTQYRCDDPLGSAFDDFFQQQAAPQAVRNRTRLIAQEIVALAAQHHHRTLKIASIGSGPAWDVRQALEQLPAGERTRLQIVLLDLDPHALDFARDQLTPLVAPHQLQCVHANLARLPRLTKALAVIDRADLIFATGFLDYLSNEKSVAFVRALDQSLGSHGRLLVFNFSHHNPSRAYMEWMGNWYLNYRSRDELRGVACAAMSAGRELDVEVESTGVNLYLRVRAHT